MARGFTRTGAFTSFLRNDSFSGVITAYPFTLACWADTPNAVSAQGALWVGDSTAATNFALLSFAGNLGGDPLRAISYSTSVAAAVTTTGYTTNTWHHGCAVFNSTTSRTAYIDGGSAGSNTTTRAFPTINSFCIGMRGDLTPVNEFSGEICEVAIWTAGLNASDVAALAAGVSPMMVRPSSLVVYCPLIRDAQELIGGRTPTAGATTITVERHARIIHMAPQSFFPTTTAQVYNLAADTGLVTIAGQPADLQRDTNINAETGAATIAGQAADLLHDRALIAETGAVAVDGQDADLDRDAVVLANTGDVDINGQTAGLIRGRPLACDAGSVTITGQDTLFRKDYQPNLDAGAFIIAGQDVDLQHDKILYAFTGSVAISGQPTDFMREYVVLADTGAVIIEGQDAILAKGVENTLDAGTGSVLIVGQDAGLRKDYTLACSAGTITITGQDADLIKESDRFVIAETGAMLIVGQDVDLIYSGSAPSTGGNYNILRRRGRR